MSLGTAAELGADLAPFCSPCLQCDHTGGLTEREPVVAVHGQRLPFVWCGILRCSWGLVMLFTPSFYLSAARLCNLLIGCFSVTQWQPQLLVKLLFLVPITGLTAAGKAIRSLWRGVPSSTLDREGQACLARRLAASPLCVLPHCRHGWLPVCREPWSLALAVQGLLIQSAAVTEPACPAPTPGSSLSPPGWP